MHSDWTYDPDLPIDLVMRRWPAAIPVLLRHRMLCVGCPIGGFHTIPEACDGHGLDVEDFVNELASTITGKALRPAAMTRAEEMQECSRKPISNT